eukprot:SAG31_NODE_29592_length_392_cov_3.259386_1_plen_79_part_01
MPVRASWRDSGIVARARTKGGLWRLDGARGDDRGHGGPSARIAARGPNGTPTAPQLPPPHLRPTKAVGTLTGLPEGADA